MRKSKKLILAITLLAPLSARGDWYGDLLKWASWAKEKGALTPFGLFPTPCNDVRKINGKEYRICPGTDLREAKRITESLENANLQDANLEGVDLTVSDLRNANLQRANLKNAILNHAGLEGANLSRANLTGAKLNEAKLTGATLTYANLEGANLNRAILTGANLSSAILKRTILIGVNFENADLRYANLQHATLSSANIINVNFLGADLTHCLIGNIEKFEGAHGDVYRDGHWSSIQTLIKTSVAMQSRKLQYIGPGATELGKYIAAFRKEEKENQPTSTKRKAEKELITSAKRERIESQPEHRPQTVFPTSISEVPSTSTGMRSLEQAPTINTQLTPGPAQAAEISTPKITEKPKQPQQKVLGLLKKPAETSAAKTEEREKVQTTQEQPSTATAAAAETETQVATKNKKPKTTEPKAVKQENAITPKPATPVEKAKPIENSLIKRYLTKLDLLFTPNVALNNNYITSLNTLGDMVQRYPALLHIHTKFVERPGSEFYKYFRKAENDLNKVTYSKKELTSELDDLFKKIRTTLWAKEDMNEWVNSIINSTFNEKNGNITLKDPKKNVIYAIKESFSIHLKNKVRPLMNEQAPIAQLYAYFDAINNQLNEIKLRDTAIGPMVSIQDALKATVYEKGKQLKSEFAPFKNTIEKLIKQLDKKVELPKTDDVFKRNKKIEEVRKEFRTIRTTMDREYEKKR